MFPVLDIDLSSIPYILVKQMSLHRLDDILFNSNKPLIYWRQHGC